MGGLHQPTAEGAHCPAAPCSYPERIVAPRADPGESRSATVGDHQATVIVAGWAYAIGNGIPWVDQQGVTHEGGWPSCLGPPGRTVPVTFGEVPVTAPDGQSWRQVV